MRSALLRIVSGLISAKKGYQQNPEVAITNYIAALKLGGTKTLPELFNAAGLPFDLSPAYISGLMQFVKNEADNLYQ